MRAGLRRGAICPWSRRTRRSAGRASTRSWAASPPAVAARTRTGIHGFDADPADCARSTRRYSGSRGTVWVSSAWVLRRNLERKLRPAVRRIRPSGSARPHGHARRGRTRARHPCTGCEADLVLSVRCVMSWESRFPSECARCSGESSGSVVIYRIRARWTDRTAMVQAVAAQNGANGSMVLTRRDCRDLLACLPRPEHTLFRPLNMELPPLGPRLLARRPIALQPLRSTGSRPGRDRDGEPSPEPSPAGCAEGR